MRIVQTSLKSSNLFSLFKIESLTVGECLVFDILIKRDSDYVIIIEAGTILSTELYEKLQKQDKLYISKEDEGKQTLTCESLQAYIEYNVSDLEKSLHFLYKLNSDVYTDYLNSDKNKISVECIEYIVKSIIFLTKNCTGFLKDIIPNFESGRYFPFKYHRYYPLQCGF